MAAWSPGQYFLLSENIRDKLVGMSKEFTVSTLALRNVSRKPLRTAILMVAIGLLVFMLIFALSFVRRVNSGIDLTSRRLGADLLILPQGTRGLAEEVLLESNAKSFYMDKALIERVRAIEGVAELSPQTYLVSIQGVCCDVPEALIVAFDQESDFIVKPWLAKAINRPLEPDEAIVGYESFLNIDIGLMEIDTNLLGNRFHIVGTLEKTGTGLDHAIFIRAEDKDKILARGDLPITADQISAIFAKVDKGYDPSEVAKVIESTIMEVDAVARKDIAKGLIRALGDISRIFSLAVALASLLALFLAWAVFSAVVNERAREVGIMRAIGARESLVMRIFLQEVLLIGLLGSLAGMIGGTIFSFLLADMFNIMQEAAVDLGGLERLVIAVLGLLTGTGICVAGALAPVNRVKKLEPLAVIKGE